MTINEKVRMKNCNFKIPATKALLLVSSKIDKYEYLTTEKILSQMTQHQIINKLKITFSILKK